MTERRKHDSRCRRRKAPRGGWPAAAWRWALGDFRVPFAVNLCVEAVIFAVAAGAIAFAVCRQDAGAQPATPRGNRAAVRTLWHLPALGDEGPAVSPISRHTGRRGTWSAPATN